MKLSKAQKEVIKKMREGWVNVTLFLTRGTDKVNLNNNTQEALKRMELIEYVGYDKQRNNVYQLTELGKTTEIENL